jgi:hypothetical protein
MSAPVELSPIKQAFLALQAAEARIAELEQGVSERVAIVGIASMP